MCADKGKDMDKTWEKQHQTSVTIHCPLEKNKRTESPKTGFLPRIQLTQNTCGQKPHTAIGTCTCMQAVILSE